MKIKSNFISSNNCSKLFWYKIKLCIGDGFCDDIANTLACDYDDGDCCVEDPNTDYCVICDCIINDGNYCLFFTKRAQIIHKISLQELQFPLNVFSATLVTSIAMI